MNQNAEALKRNFLELTELKHILRKTQVFFDEVGAKWSCIFVFIDLVKSISVSLDKVVLMNESVVVVRYNLVLEIFTAIPGTAVRISSDPLMERHL